MKEKHYHRNIVEARIKDRHYVTLTLSCGHVKDMSRHAYLKFHAGKNNATLCIKCSVEKVREDSK